MSKLHGNYKGHKFHGAPERFEITAKFIYEYFGNNVKYIADVAGGKGMLTRILNKKYNYEAEVVDPRGYALKGVPNRQEEYKSEMADYYDLVVGLHPDEATRPVVESAIIRPIIIIPCCNFWDLKNKLGRDELLNSIEDYFKQKNIKYKKIEIPFKSSRNIGFVSTI